IMLKKLIVSVLLCILILSSWVGTQGFSFLTQAPSETYKEQIFEVKTGTFTQNAIRLQREGLITNSRYFIWYAKFRGDTTRLKKGEYRLSANFTPKQILEELTSGNVVKYPLTIPEGYNIYDIAALVEAKSLATREDFLKFATDASLATKIIERPVPSFEGFLFPETYNFSKSEGAKGMVIAMATQFKKVYDQILRDPNLMQLPFIEHVTMASMIEKETGDGEERELISSVFHNRLRKHMRLQSDPTILYGIMIEDGVWKQNIQKADILRSTKYNTYTIPGLPPAPIANPGEEALRAALNPADTQYLYFVSKNNGTHVFTKTYQDHNKAVRDFQLNRKAREGKSWRNKEKTTK
ncbi:MAG: endolytic transglycosylase MltG, partial [Bdellovibrionales bacterium]|nr:endolytic transglycosylase MltG [Bdellovibrionales bacterium]